ncbi:MAG: phosphoesterase, partial [Anaerolineae bacterium]|nr:phosphoesterase [Anaerolineae bacterium]
LPLRKLPDVSGKLRVISIGDFDVTACGGTHVARTGEIGLIKVIRSEKYKDMTRVEFRCGGRALRDYREKNALLLGLAADLTVGYWELGEAVERLRAEGKQLRADLRAARQAVLDGVADSWWRASEAGPDGVRIVRRVLMPGEYDAGELRALASKLVERQGVVLLGLAGEKANLILARHADLAGPDMVEALQRAVGTITGEANARRGGGRPDFAQGGGFAADAAALEAALAAAEAFVRAALA